MCNNLGGWGLIVYVLFFLGGGEGVAVLSTLILLIRKFLVWNIDLHSKIMILLLMPQKRKKNI